jgi:predicted nucleic acid-binding protein
MAPVKVVDASSMIDFLTDAPRLMPFAHHLDDDLFAPDLLIAEVHDYFRRRGVRQPHEQLDAHVDAFHSAAIEYLPSWPYGAQIWKWRHNLTSYDACYVALAHDLHCPLLTSDRRLAAAAQGIVPVILI